MRRRHTFFAALALVVAAALPAQAADDTWPSIRAAVFGEREIRDGAGVIELEAPKRAADAAIVPITIRAAAPQTAERYIRSVHLIIDQNPAPVAAIFHLYPETGDATLATRVRVDQYTSMRAVAEMSDGALYAVERFVKAAGGCSAPAQKDKAAAMARLGQMKLKPLSTFAPGTVQQAQLLISHPNYSGLQIDQLTRHWVPPDYVRSVKVSQGGRPVLEIEGDISIAEDPSFTFSFVPQTPEPLRVVVDDSENRHFEGSFEIGAGS